MPALPAHALHLAAAQQPAHVTQVAAVQGQKKDHAQTKKMPRTRVTSHGYEYIIIDNRLLSEATVQRLIKGAKGPRAAVGALKKAYEKRGYFLIGIVGRRRGKRIQVRIVQGRVTHLKGPKPLTWYFSGLKGNNEIRTSDVIRRAILARAFDATNGQQPQIRFKPAPEFAGSTMEISEKPIKGHHPVGGSLTFGNFGNRYAGRYLAQGQVYAQSHGLTLQANQSRAIAGLSESTHGAYYNSTGLSLSDITPWGIYQLDYNYTKYQLGDAFFPLYPQGRIQTYAFKGTQLLYADASRRWSLKEGFQHVHNQGSYFHGYYMIRDQNYDVWHVGSDFSWRFGGLLSHAASLSLGGNVQVGTSPGGDTGFRSSVPGSPTPHFSLYSANASVSQSLPADFLVKLDLSGQATPDTLPQNEQWVLGGLNNLTAYLPGTVVGDSGYLARFTLQSPALRAGPLSLEPKLFFEHGAARYTYVRPNNPTWQALCDVGASLSLNVPASRTSATLAYAQPVGSRDVSPSFRQGQRAHLFFYVSQAF